MRKHLTLFLFLFCQLLSQAQILEPIKWHIQLKNSGKSDKEIIFTAKIDEGWHLYNMNLPQGGPVSTTFHFEKIKGATLKGKTTVISKAINKKDDTFGLELSWFIKEAIFVQKIDVTDKKKFEIEGNVEFMGCNDVTCLPPTPVKFKFTGLDLAKIDKSIKSRRYHKPTY